MSKIKIFQENINDIIYRPGEMRERVRDIELPENWGEGVAHVEAGENLRLDMRFESVHEGILASINVTTNYVAECGRCLTEFKNVLEVEFTELFAYTLTEADEYGVHGDHVNLEPPLRDAVVLALPFQPVCSQDCAGLDPQTGEKLEAGKAEKFPEEIDPRWAALAGLKAKIENNI